MGPTEASALAAIATVVATVALAGLTSWYVALTHRLVRSQTDPYVVVYVRHDESRPSIMLIVIENAGRSLARDVTFVLSRSIPHRAFGVDEASARARPIQQMTRGPLITGVPALGPGERRELVWGQ